MEFRISAYGLDKENPKLFQFRILLERRHLLAFREWIRSLSEHQQGHIFKVISAEKPQGRLGFIKLDVTEALTTTSEIELEETCSRLLYDMVANMVLETSSGVVSFAQEGVVPAPAAWNLKDIEVFMEAI